MLVIDYLRHMKADTISVPSFHRGHLGFMPDTPVSIALMTEPAAKECGCEILITPFNCNTSNFFKLSCTLGDQPGAVDRVVAAVSSFNLNIILQESAPANHSRHHVINMTLDWTPSEWPERQVVPLEYQRSYSALSQALPPADFRYFKLYERLVKICGDILTWKPSLNPARDLPQITITSFEQRRLFISGDSVVKTTPGATEDEPASPERGRRIKCIIPIPPKLLDSVREFTGHQGGDPIPYVLASDTATRTLRVSFLRRDAEGKVVHVSFLHRNQAGALATITALLAKAQFNIVTSILRVEDQVKNAWEVLLEAREADVPSLDGSVATAIWVKERLMEHSGPYRGALRKFGVHITTPRYPASRHKRFSEPLFFETDTPYSDNLRLQDYDFSRAQEAIERHGKKNRREWVLSQFASERPRPRIFFSYPATARLHVDIIRTALGKQFIYDEYQEPNAADITQSVIKKIEESDYFLAVWHPEPGKPTEISPWMPFEFGIASVLEKKSIIVIAQTVDERNWRRISPNISRHRYNDAEFSLKTVPSIVEYVNRHWLPEGEGLSDQLSI